MSKTLSISNQLLSLRGRMLVTDEAKNDQYEVRGEFALFSPTWRVKKELTDVATIRRRVFSWRPTWDVRSRIGTFHIERKLFTLTRIYRVVGGIHDGATIRGNFWDLKFEVERSGTQIASAVSKIFTLRDTHVIEVLDSSEDAELFVVICMTTLQIDRRAESGHASHASQCEA